ncbi:hypothetical protein MTYP_03251 [Methylophilaceae bacterium]|nr:hypothetical protein MTYP_03251 [Methylophilaceae bacterium]
MRSDERLSRRYTTLLPSGRNRCALIISKLAKRVQNIEALVQSQCLWGEWLNFPDER